MFENTLQHRAPCPSRTRGPQLEEHPARAPHTHALRRRTGANDRQLSPLSEAVCFCTPPASGPLPELCRGISWGILLGQPPVCGGPNAHGGFRAHPPTGHKGPPTTGRGVVAGFSRRERQKLSALVRTCTPRLRIVAS